MTMQRQCSSCGKKKPLTAEFFPQDTRREGDARFRSRCLPCYNDNRRKIHGAPYVSKPPRPTEEKLSPIVEHRLKAKVAQQELRIRQLLADLDSAQKTADLRSRIAEQKVTPIRPRERAQGKLREATALVCASDWHIEEEVRQDQVAGRNRYNLEISERRMQRFFEATRYATQFNRQIFKIRDCIMWLGGDIITNYLREEDVESNLLSPPRAVAYAIASLSAGIRYLLEDGELERLVIPCNDGNHGRLDGKNKIKHRTRTDNSLEWLMYTMLAREFADDKRVQFQIATGEQLFLEVYGRTVRFMHGDSVHYAGGVGGVTIPIYKAIARYDTVRKADLTVMGHFHQLTSLPDLIINGSLIGYSPYSLTIGARFEPPAQAFTILDPLRFKSVSMPLWVSERGDDINTKE